MREGIEDVVFCFLRFPSGLAAHLHLSWLDPHKERRFTVVGEQRMATFDDMALEGKITVYDKGFDEQAGRSSYGEYITRSGDIWSPRLPNVEPLRTECEHFVESIRNGTTPISDGEAGLRVVRVLEGLQQSLDETRRERRRPLGRADRELIVIDPRALKVRAFRAIRAGAGRVGLQVVPKTYYSPIPDLDALPPDVFDRRSELRGIHFDLDEQVAWIEQNLADGDARVRAARRTWSTTRPTGASARTCCTASCGPQAAPDRRARLRALDAVHGRRGGAQPRRRASRPSCGRSTRIPSVARPGAARARRARARCARRTCRSTVFTALEAGRRAVRRHDAHGQARLRREPDRARRAAGAARRACSCTCTTSSCPYEYPRRVARGVRLPLGRAVPAPGVPGRQPGLRGPARPRSPCAATGPTRWRAWRRPGGPAPRRARSGSGRQPVQQRRHPLRDRRAAERRERGGVDRRRRRVEQPRDRPRDRVLVAGRRAAGGVAEPLAAAARTRCPGS